MHAGLTPAQRAAALLAQMNLTEKITMVHGWDGPYVGNVIANTRLGIPALYLNDGPQVQPSCSCQVLFVVSELILFYSREMIRPLVMDEYSSLPNVP